MAILTELHAAGTRLVALTNWSAETFPYAEAAFDFLELFEGIVVSGRRGRRQTRSGLFRPPAEPLRPRPGRTVFIDDSPRTSPQQPRPAWSRCVFSDADRLRADLSRLGLLDGAGSG